MLLQRKRGEMAKAIRVHTGSKGWEGEAGERVAGVRGWWREVGKQQVSKTIEINVRK